MFPGNVDAYLANVEERHEHDRRVNATTLAKRRQLETFIAKNRARASTASQAKSKAKQLERLELIDIEGAEVDRAVPLSRHRAAARPGRADASIWRSAIRTTRSPATSTSRSITARGSASSATTARARRRSCGPCATRCRRWPAKSPGATAARSASMPSTSTPRCPNNKTVLEYLEYQAAPRHRSRSRS